MTPAPRQPLVARADLLSGAALFLVAAGALASGWRLPWGSLTRPGPGFFPRTLALLLAALALALVGRGMLRPGPDLRARWAGAAGRRRVLLMTVALVGYVAVVETAGYLATTAALFVVMVRWVGGRGWLATVLTSAIAAGGSYFLFHRLLNVPLP